MIRRCQKAVRTCVELENYCCILSKNLSRYQDAAGGLILDWKDFNS